jgi:hypothetical protein
MPTRQQKLFSRLGYLFSRRENIFSKLGYIFSSLENNFIRCIGILFLGYQDVFPGGLFVFFLCPNGQEPPFLIHYSISFFTHD